MSGTEEDFSHLPLAERWQHTKWNVRQEAYKEAGALFQKSAYPTDECFAQFVSNPNLLKSAATDSNVAALDAGITTVGSFLEFGEPSSFHQIRDLVLKPMLEKGFVAVKPSVKTAATNTTLFFVETAANPAVVLEDVISLLSAKLPKVITQATITLNEIYTQFGAKAVPPQPVLKALPKLFAHTDKNVRAEAVKLSVTLYRWLGGAVLKASLADIKPVQMKDLEDLFTKADADGAPSQARLLRSQQASSGADADSVAAGDENDVNMGNDEIDPYDLLDAVAVAGKLPNDLETQLTSVKWKERKDALDEVAAAFNTPKIVPDDFTHVIHLLSRVIQKDANVMCVTQAVISVKELAIGLRSAFTKYASSVLPHLVERFKEKKPAVIEAVSDALFAIYEWTSLGEVLSYLIAAMAHKVPQVKIETTRFLSKCLSTTSTAPSIAEVKEITAPALKLMTDTQEPVRQEAAKLLGTLLKLVGERAFMPSLESLDDIRKNKVKEAAETIEVRAQVRQTAVPKSTLAASTRSAAPAPARRAAAPAATSTAVPATRSAAPGTRVGTRPTAASSSGAPPSSPASTRARAPISGTPLKKTGARTMHTAEFTPARQPEATRRRLVSPAKTNQFSSPASSITRPTAGTRSIARPTAGLRSSERPAGIEEEPTQMTHASQTKFDMLQREKVILMQERDIALQEKSLMERKLEQMETMHQRTEFELQAAKQQMRSQQLQLEATQSELNQLRLHLENSGSSMSLDNVSRDMTNMSLNNRRLSNGSNDSDAMRRSSRLITLGTPRAPRAQQTFDGSPMRDGTRQASPDLAVENWRRAQEVSNDLKKRIEELKRQRAKAL